MIKKHGIHDSQSTVLSSTDNGYGNPFIVEQPDFNDVPPNWWEKRTNEEKVFIYATSVLSFLGFIYATDCYYESVKGDWSISRVPFDSHFFLEK